MTRESENVKILERIYDDWISSMGRETAYWMSVLDEDATLTSLADGHERVPFTRPPAGKEGFRLYLQGLADAWEMVDSTVDEFIAQGERVVVLGSARWRNKSSGKVLDTPRADVWRMRGGKIVEFSEFYDTAKVMAAATP